MEFLQYSVIAVGVIVIYYGDKILKRLPHRPPEIPVISPKRGGRFVVWMPVERFWLNEYQIGHIDEWTNGHQFTAVGQASFEPELDIERASFTFFSSATALSKTEVIGYGTKSERSAELRVQVKPSVARDLLDELRRSPKSQIHAQGYTNEKGVIQLTYVSFTPSHID